MKNQILSPLMKITTPLLIVFFLFLGFLKEARAQYVTIPDANFRNYLQTNYPSCMSGGMLDTTCTAVVNEITLNVNSKGITNLTGLQYFKNLIYLACASNQLGSLPILPASLTFLDCSYNQLTSLPALPSSLTQSYFQYNQLTSLPALPVSLTYLNCGNNQLSNLPALPVSLTVLICNDNQLSSLPILPGSLTQLWCSYNPLSSLSGLPVSLTSLYCYFNQLTSLPALPASLSVLGCGYNQLSSLPALPASLKNLFCGNNQLISLPVLPSLNRLLCNDNQLTSLPVLPASLTDLWCDNNQLTCLPLLPNNLQELKASGNSISCLLNIPTQPGFTSDIGYSICNPSNDANGCSVNYNNIRGNIYTDADSDCKVDAAEKRIPSVLVKATPGPYFGISDTSGNYNILVDSGSVNYTIALGLNSVYSKLLLNQCAASYNVSLSDASQDTCCFDFADSVKQCFVLDINIQKTRARQCIRGATYVNYTNYGNLPATGAVVKIEFPSHIFPITSTPIWTSMQGSVLTYNVGTIQAGESGKIIITDSVDCAVDLSHQVECIKATISPSSNCIPDNPVWDHSSMQVSGSCINGYALFVIKNHGNGNMTDSLEYRFYVNDTLIFAGNYKLNSGDSLMVNYPAVGQSIRLEADQPPLHPGKSHPRAIVENCGTPISGTSTTGLVTTAPLDDLDEEVAFTCPEITNSHDPNEKLAIPSGIGASHNIVPGKEIEYVIGFQNTGNDTAYTVIVVDTLDAGLDAASFKQGTSSHPYTLNISGKGQAVLTFRFDQINLLDSTTNLLESNGLVSYRISVPSNASIGTVIKNKAYIYFDYNAPIVTNETMHTVDTVSYKDFSKGSAVLVGAVTTGLTGRKLSQTAKIYPNPSAGMITIEMPEVAGNSELRIMSLVGVQQKSIPLSSAIQQVSLEGLSQGMYLYEVWQNGERKAGGKLQIAF
jgi:uncharacterized repeat protein (TIGR01451 family)